MSEDSLLDHALVRLDDAARHLNIDPDVIEKLRGVGVSPASGVAAEAGKYGLEEFARYTKLIKDANIKAD